MNRVLIMLQQSEEDTLENGHIYNTYQGSVQIPRSGIVAQHTARLAIQIQFMHLAFVVKRLKSMQSGVQYS